MQEMEGSDILDKIILEDCSEKVTFEKKAFE